MKIYVNGQETEVAEQLTVDQLVIEKGLNPDIIVIEHNLTVLPKEEWPESLLAADDRLEIVTFMGGG